MFFKVSKMHRRGVLFLCVGLYIGGVLIGFDAYNRISISAAHIVHQGQGMTSGLSLI